MSGRVEFYNFSLDNEVYDRVMSGLNKANKTSPAFAELYESLHARGIRVIEFYSSPPIGFRDTNVKVMSDRNHGTVRIVIHPDRSMLKMLNGQPLPEWLAAIHEMLHWDFDQIYFDRADIQHWIQENEVIRRQAEIGMQTGLSEEASASGTSIPKSKADTTIPMVYSTRLPARPRRTCGAARART